MWISSRLPIDLARVQPYVDRRSSSPGGGSSLIGTRPPQCRASTRTALRPWSRLQQAGSRKLGGLGYIRMAASYHLTGRFGVFGLTQKGHSVPRHRAYAAVSLARHFSKQGPSSAAVARPRPRGIPKNPH
jgi:hypothetical protein